MKRHKTIFHFERQAFWIRIHIHIQIHILFLANVPPWRFSLVVEIALPSLKRSDGYTWIVITHNHAVSTTVHT